MSNKSNKGTLFSFEEKKIEPKVKVNEWDFILNKKNEPKKQKEVKKEAELVDINQEIKQKEKEEEKKESTNRIKIRIFREHLVKLNLQENQRKILDFMYREHFYPFPTAVFTISIFCRLSEEITIKTIAELCKLNYIYLDVAFSNTHYRLSKELINIGS